jgi:hypothetical protein
MGDRIVVRGVLAREPAAEGITLELADQHRRADDALERGAADEPLGGGRHQHPHAVPRARRKAGQLDRAVGGDPAAHAEQDPSHPSLLGRPLPRRGSGN